jgi:prolyl 4-hydroxylase
MILEKLKDNVYEINSFLSSTECDDLINLSESLGYKKADVQTKSGRQLLTTVRNNERVDYYSEEFSCEYWKRSSSFQLPIYEQKSAVGISPYFRFYKYQPGQRFNMHKDGRQLVGKNETLFTFLICVGRETLFREGNLKICHKKGTAIFFEHYL